MNALETLYPGDGVILLAGNALVQITLFVILAALINQLFFRRHASARHAIWMICLCCGLLSPLTAWLMPRSGIALVEWPLLTSTAPQESVVEMSSPPPSPPIDRRMETAALPLLESPARSPLAAQPDDPGPNTKAKNEQTSVARALAATSPTVSTAVSAPVDVFRFTAAIVLLVWSSGVLFFLARLTRGCRAVYRLRRKAYAFEKPGFAEILREVQAAVVVGKLPPVMACDRVTVPMVVGCRAPVVLLPPESADLSHDELRDVLIHECAHVRRRDSYIGLLQLIAEAVYWPHPLVHYLNRRLAQAREESCDDFVLKQTDGRRYALLLLTMTERRGPGKVVQPSLAMVNGRWKLEHRIAGLLDGRRCRITHNSRPLMAALTLVFVAGGVLVGGTQLRPAKDGVVAVPLDDEEASSDRVAQVENSKIEEQLTPKEATDAEPLPKDARLQFGTQRFRSPTSVQILALSPDEKTVVTLGGHLIVWDTITGKERWRADPGEFGFQSGASYGVRGITFAADSGKFYTPSKWEEVIAWDTLTGLRNVTTINPPMSRPEKRLVQCESRSVELKPDNEVVAVGNAARLAVCKKNGQILYEIANNPKNPITEENVGRDRLRFGGDYSYGRFSPDGKLLAVVLSETPEEIRLCDAENGNELRRIKLKANLVRLEFSPDSKQIVATERDSAVRMYDVATGKEIWAFQIELKNNAESYTSSVAYSPDGNIVAAGAPIGADFGIYLLKAETGEKIGKLEGHVSKPWGLAFTADSKTLYSSGWDGMIRRWDVTAREQLETPGGVRATRVAAASPDGRTLAYGDDLGTIRLVHARRGTELRRLKLPGTKYTQLRYSPDGRKLAGGGISRDDVHVAVWDVADGNLLHRWDWPKGRDPHSKVNDFSFTSDGRYLAAAVFRQDAAHVWDLTKDGLTGTIEHGDVFGVSFSPDGKTLATAGWDKKLRFVDMETMKVRRTAEVEKAENRKELGDVRMYSVRYAPQGGIIATAHMNGVIRVWRADDMEVLKTFRLDGRFSYCAMNFSPDGLWLATGTGRRNVTLSDPLTGQKIWNASAHQDHLYNVGFGRDGRTIISGGDDGVCYFWDLQPKEKQSDRGLNGQWRDLRGDDSKVAFQAMQNLATTPVRTVKLLSEKLRPIKSVLDLNRVKESTEKKTERRKQLMQRLIDKNQGTTERLATVRRAISLLEQIGSPQAVALLRELASKDDRSTVRQLASDALARIDKLRR